MTTNLVTICTADEWAYTYLHRFSAMARIRGGKVKLHLLLVTDDNSDPDETDYIKKQCDCMFDVVKVFKRRASKRYRQHLVYYDALRAGLITIFGLDSLLYLDPDADVTCDISGINCNNPDLAGVELGWVYDAVPIAAVISDLARCGFDAPIPVPVGGGPFYDGDKLAVKAYRANPLMAAGCIYMTRDFSLDFQNIYDEYADKFSTHIVGTTIWNILKQSVDHTYRLPDTLHTSFWNIPGTCNAQIVHYSGVWKNIMPFVSYSRGKHPHLKIHPEIVQFNGYARVKRREL